MDSGFPRLVGDIGGTNARFALIMAAGAAMEQVAVLRCAEYPTAADAAQRYLEDRQVSPRSAALGIANPLKGDLVRMTNHHWSFSIDALRAELNLDRLVMLNDFTAMALGVPSLTDTERLRIGRAPDATGPIGVLGPGTGLGVSGLLPVRGGYLALAGEGGHTTLPATTDAESDALAWLRSRHGHVSAERVLSGPGLVELHRAVCALHGTAANDNLTPADITATATRDPASTCRSAVDMFCEMLATVASNLALTLGATGGVYLAGGVVPALGDLFMSSAFRVRFETKGRFSGYLAGIPTYIVQAPYCALHGAARALDGDHLQGTIDSRTHTGLSHNV